MFVREELHTHRNTVFDRTRWIAILLLTTHDKGKLLGLGELHYTLLPYSLHSHNQSSKSEQYMCFLLNGTSSSSSKSKSPDYTPLGVPSKHSNTESNTKLTSYGHRSTAGLISHENFRYVAALSFTIHAHWWWKIADHSCVWLHKIIAFFHNCRVEINVPNSGSVQKWNATGTFFCRGSLGSRVILYKLYCTYNMCSIYSYDIFSAEYKKPFLNQNFYDASLDKRNYSTTC